MNSTELPDSPTSGQKRPPTFLDNIERVLLRIILGAVLALALLLGFAAWQTRHQKPGMVAALPATTTVSLVVDFGDGAQKRLSGLASTPGMTVLDVMNLAKSHARPVEFTSNGAGERALLTSIDGVKNEGIEAGITTARCWQYWVNGQYGRTSMGVAKVSPGDWVIWAYRPYESDPKPPAR